MYNILREINTGERSMLTEYSVEKLLHLYEAGALNIRPEFQRRPNWPSGAKSYFVDTILRGFPSPLLYLKPTVDAKTKRPVYEVVDGQQRLTSLIEFFTGELRLDRQTKEFAGLTFQDLDIEDQEKFLKYIMGSEELLNASDDYVLDVFHRLNAHGVQLNSQELRHSRFLEPRHRGAFRLEVIESSRRWAVLWERYKVVNLKTRTRMADDELMAQLIGVLLNGVTDGGQNNINNLYMQYDADVPRQAIESLDSTMEFILNKLTIVFDTRLRGAPHYLILFASVAHALFGLPNGDMGRADNPELPQRDNRSLSDLGQTLENLRVLGDVLNSKEADVPRRFFDFKLASAGTTQRIKSRSIRFVHLFKALQPKAI